MWRPAFLALSTNRAVRSFATRNALARRIAARFVAGETIDEAVAVAGELTRRGASVEMDYLGESVRDREAAQAARDSYLELVESLADGGMDVQVSVKVTQMGIDVDEALCMDNVCSIAAATEALGGFLWLDMESSAYTERTLAVYSRLRSQHANAGIALQAYLYRTDQDLQRVLDIGGTVRLCKGAYSESSSVAFSSKSEVDRNFARLSERLLGSGTFQAIATHDEKMIRHVRGFASDKGIDPGRFEFQMLYGVRRDLQQRLIGQGYRVRIYVPYGEEWYPYFMRRLAERPANLLFLLGSLVKDRGQSPSRKPVARGASDVGIPVEAGSSASGTPRRES